MNSAGADMVEHRYRHTYFARCGAGHRLKVRAVSPHKDKRKSHVEYCAECRSFVTMSVTTYVHEPEQVRELQSFDRIRS